jgi:hypothetical protein
MNLKEYNMVFAVGSLILILLATAPTLNLVFSFPSGKAQFSELWILGSNHVMQGYPFNVRIKQSYQVFVGVRNQMGSTLHYVVYVKFRNQTQPLPDSLNSMPSPLPPLYEYHVFIADEGTWESSLTFNILRASRVNNSTLINDISIEDAVFSVNSSAAWDSENRGYHYQVFLELWLYNTTSMNFQYHNRFVAFWLNFTGESF